MKSLLQRSWRCRAAANSLVPALYHANQSFLERGPQKGLRSQQELLNSNGYSDQSQFASGTRSLHSTTEAKEASWISSISREPPKSSFVEPSREATEQEERDMAIYEHLKEFVMEKRGGKREYLELLERYNPRAEHREPCIVDLRPPDRELPPADRVTIAVDTDDQFRVTRKTKWAIKQLRSSASVIDDVPTFLEQWVKTMYPKRSDWIDLLKEFDEEQDRELMFQIFEFALLEDTFDVRSQDVTKIIVKYINLERYDDVERVINTLDTKGFPPDFVVSTLLLDMYCNLRNLDKAKEMYDRIRSMGYAPDVTACTKLIDFYSTSGNPEAAEMLLAEMEDEKVHGTVDTYLAVLKGYGKLGKVNEAVRIFGMIKQDIFLRPHMGHSVYSALMDAYTRANKLPSAVMMMEDMLLSGLEPEDESIALLIAAYEKSNQFERALDVLLKLESKAIRPGVETLTNLICWFGKLGLIDEAKILFKNIEEKVESPDCKAYASLFSAYARSGFIDKAESILNLVQEKKLALNEWAYEQVILSLLEGKQSEKAVSLRDQMISDGYTPSDEVERALLGVQTESFLAGVSKPADDDTDKSQPEKEESS